MFDLRWVLALTIPIMLVIMARAFIGLRRRQKNDLPVIEWPLMLVFVACLAFTLPIVVVWLVLDGVRAEMGPIFVNPFEAEH